MRNNSFKAALCLAFIATAGQAAAAAAIDPARQVAPADGWASQAGGTVGGSAAIESQIYTVTTRAQLLAEITNGGTTSRSSSCPACST